MPEQTTSASSEAATVGGQPIANPGADSNGEVRAVTPDSMSNVMHKLGLNPAVREKMQAKFGASSGAAESGQVTEPETGTAAAEDEGDNAGEQVGEAPAEAHEGETPAVEGDAGDEIQGEGDEAGISDEADEDEEAKATADANPDIQKLKTKIYRQRKRAQRAELAATEAQAKITELSAQLEKAAPIFITPTLEQPLAHVTDAASLETAKKEFRQARDQALMKPGGWIENEGTDSEYVVSASEAAQRRIYAENVLSDHFPRKEKEIAEIRPAATAAARAILPDMFKVGTADHQVAQAFRNKFPEVAARPEGDHLTAVFCWGLRAMAAMEKTSAANNGKKLQVPQAILKAHDDKGKVTVQKQKPPGRSSMAPSPSDEVLKNAMATVRKTGGSRDSLAAGILALNKASNPSGRTPAPV